MRRDYCGWALGFQRKHSQFALVQNQDGEALMVFDDPNEDWFLCSPVLTWPKTEKKKFIMWLAAQSDYSLSGYDTSSVVGETLKKNGDSQFYVGNQTISKFDFEYMLKSPRPATFKL